MLCSHPKKTSVGGNGYPVACRKCMPCRLNRRKELTARIIMETMSHEHSIFVTLTYADQFLPDIDQHPNGNIYKKEIQNFLKRLRFSLSKNQQIRYFAVGEYGEKSGRAHYHLIIFNMDYSERSEQLINTAWQKGHIRVDENNEKSASYVARYTTKKLGGDLAVEKYQGKNPEFALYSRKPALGTETATLIAETMAASKSRNFLYEGVIRMKGKKYKLDEFMLRHISWYYQKLTGEPMRPEKHVHLTHQEQYELRKISRRISQKIFNKSVSNEKI